LPGQNFTHVLILDDDAVLPAETVEVLASAMAEKRADLAYPLVTGAEGRVGWLPGLQDRALGLRDYARLDFRLTGDGRLVFIEANPNSDLTPNTLGRNLCFVGIDYKNLIPRIVETAHKRYGRGRRNVK